jgi:hypothetical protein
MGGYPDARAPQTASYPLQLMASVHWRSIATQLATRRNTTDNALSVIRSPVVQSRSSRTSADASRTPMALQSVTELNPTSSSRRHASPEAPSPARAPAPVGRRWRPGIVDRPPRGLRSQGRQRSSGGELAIARQCVFKPADVDFPLQRQTTPHGRAPHVLSRHHQGSPGFVQHRAPC